MGFGGWEAQKFEDTRHCRYGDMGQKGLWVTFGCPSMAGARQRKGTGVWSGHKTAWSCRQDGGGPREEGRRRDRPVNLTALGCMERSQNG